MINQNKVHWIYFSNELFLLFFLVIYNFVINFNYRKNHIINNGGIASVTAANDLKYYNNSSNPFLATAYFCNNSKDIILYR